MKTYYPGQDTLSRKEKMAQFAVPPAPISKTRAFIAITTLAAISTLSYKLTQSSFLGVKQEAPLVRAIPISIANLATPEIDFQITKLRERDVINGQGVLKVGDCGTSVKNFLSCFRSLEKTYYFDHAAEQVVRKFQLENALPVTGQVDQQTVSQLKKLGIIQIDKSGRGIELGKSYLPLIFDPENKADCVSLAKRFFSRVDFTGHAHGIENSLIANQKYEQVVSNAISLLETSNSLSSSDLKLLGRLKLVEEALQLGIGRPLMFTETNLAKLVANYNQASPSKFNACLVVTSYDGNGAFYNVEGFNELVRYFLDQDSNVRFVMPTKDSEFKGKLAQALTIGSELQKADFIVYCFHGFRSGFQVSSENSSESLLNLGEGHLRNLNPYINAGATEILYSCSTANAEGIGQENTLAHSLYSSRSGKTQVLAPRTDCNLLIGDFVDLGTGDPIRLEFAALSKPLHLKFIAPQLQGLIGDPSLYPQAAVTRLRARNTDSL